MEVTEYIRELLYFHDCVIVPGFGGFVTNEQPAKADHVTGTFNPPARDIGFNSRLNHNDGLLISHISTRLSINYVDAGKLVESFSEDVNTKLQSGGQVFFEGIGRFEIDRDKNLQFDPEPGANFLPDSYGLGFFRFQPLDNRYKKARADEKLPGPTAGTGVFRARKMLRYAAVGIPLIAALSWGAVNRDLIREFDFNFSYLNPFAAVVDSGLEHYPLVQDRLPYADSPSPSIEDGLIETAASDNGLAEYVNADREASAEVDKIQERRHYIIAGSFKSRRNADQLSETLTREGYSCDLIESEDDFYRVSLFSTSNRHDALQMLRRVRSVEGMDEAWMLSR